MAGWADLRRNLKETDLEDRRPDKRAIALLDTLSARPTESIPSACSRWSQMIAAYRFFDNDEVRWDGLLTLIRRVRKRGWDPAGSC